jgi:autotransporter-associated beta strand protein
MSGLAPDAFLSREPLFSAEAKSHLHNLIPVVVVAAPKASGLPLQSPLKKIQKVPCIPMGIVTNDVILRALRGDMRACAQTSKGRQLHSSPFGLLLVLAGALLLLTALAPRANAGSTDYWDVEDPQGSRPRPALELLSQPQGVLINQPLASNYNPSLASNVASGGQPGAFQPQQVNADASWTGAGLDSNWNNAANWTAGGPPNAIQTANFDGTFTNQPNVTLGTTVGEIHMATGVAQNVTISSSAAQILTIEGVLGTGILIDNTSAFTLTITARVGLDASQTWTNNSGNLFTVSGATLGLGEDNTLVVNGTGNTLISAVTDGAGMGSSIIKDGSGTLTLTAPNAYSGGTTVIGGGTLLVNNTVGSGTGDGDVTVTGAGTTLGGTGIISERVTVNIGANLAPGNGGHTTSVLTVGAVTLSPGANFLVDINGTTPGTGYDRLIQTAGGNNTFVITNSNLVVTVGTTLSVGQTFLIGQRTAGGAINGQFLQGSTVTGSDGSVFAISYTGGNGNDIVLTVVTAAVPEPSTWMGGALAIAGLAFTQRRRLRKLIAFSR